MERKFKFSISEFYHVYNRGNNKSVIFHDQKDRIRFQKLLFICNSKEAVVFKSIQGLPLDKINRGETLVDIGAYCLMPNHFHLLLHEKRENGISIFLGKLSTAYSMYFNKKYQRTGKLFEGAFRAEHVDNDDYLNYLFAYIHLNPVKIIHSKWKESGIKDLLTTKKYLFEYPFSSYLDFIGQEREEKDIIDILPFPNYFEESKDFERFINDWLKVRFIQGESLDGSPRIFQTKTRA